MEQAAETRYCAQRACLLVGQRIGDDRTRFGANENGPTFANQKDPTRMAVGLTPAADDFI